MVVVVVVVVCVCGAGLGCGLALTLLLLVSQLTVINNIRNEHPHSALDVCRKLCIDSAFMNA